MYLNNNKSKFMFQFNNLNNKKKKLKNKQKKIMKTKFIEQKRNLFHKSLHKQMISFYGIYFRRWLEI